MKQITKEGIVSFGEFPEFTAASVFGSGSNPDGTVAMDGVNSFTSFANKTGSGSGAVYTLLRNIYVNALTVGTASNSITLKANGFKIYCSGTVTLTKGAISCNGNDGTAGLNGTGSVGGGLGGSGGIVFGSLMSAVTQTDPPRVEMKGFKLTHPEGKAGGLPSDRRTGRMSGRYGQPTHGATARSNQEPGGAWMENPTNCQGIGRQPQYRPRVCAGGCRVRGTR